MPKYSTTVIDKLEALGQKPADACIFKFYLEEKFNEKHSLYELANPVGSKRHLELLNSTLSDSSEVGQALNDISQSSFCGKAKRLDALARECIEKRNFSSVATNRPMYGLRKDLYNRSITDAWFSKVANSKRKYKQIPEKLYTLDKNPVDALIFLFYYTERLHEKHSLYKLKDKAGSRKHFELFKTVTVGEAKECFAALNDSAFYYKAKKWDNIAEDCVKKTCGFNPYDFVPSRFALSLNPAISAMNQELKHRILAVARAKKEKYTAGANLKRAAIDIC